MVVYRPNKSFGSTAISLVSMAPLTMYVWPAILLVWSAFLVTSGNRSGWMTLFLTPFFIMVPCVTWWWLRQAWKNWYVGERWAAYFQTGITLAVKIPEQPIRLIWRHECIAFTPETNTITLDSGRTERLPGNPVNRDKRFTAAEGVMLAWWPENAGDIALGKPLFRFPGGQNGLLQFFRFAAMPMMLGGIVSLVFDVPYATLVFAMAGWIWLAGIAVRRTRFRFLVRREIALPRAAVPDACDSGVSIGNIGVT